MKMVERQPDGSLAIVGNRLAGTELERGSFAPVQRDPNVLNDEVFISLCLRKIKDQCRHIQLPVFTDPERVRIDASKSDPASNNWLPFVCYVRRPYPTTNHQVHFVMTNFFRTDDDSGNPQAAVLNDGREHVFVWSPQFALLNCQAQIRAGDLYHERLKYLAEEFDITRDGNVTQIFNCNIGYQQAVFSFVPVTPIYALDKDAWSQQQPHPPFDLHSAYAALCIAMVKHIVLEIQKHQRLRRRFPRARMPPASSLMPITFVNFELFFSELGFSLDPATGRYRFDDGLLRESRYRYTDNRVERKSYRITITELNIFDYLARVYAPPDAAKQAEWRAFLDKVAHIGTQIYFLYRIFMRRNPQIKILPQRSEQAVYTGELIEFCQILNDMIFLRTCVPVFMDGSMAAVAYDANEFARVEANLARAPSQAIAMPNLPLNQQLNLLNQVLAAN
ncbi:MAG: hypothetical protein E6Q06_02100 [Candidatus Moraniibacteriota bacterium]|nr:MAG: hypothetical protein E6Q06_02100 [Candidatus Moranbacteria bacterium]